MAARDPIFCTQCSTECHEDGEYYACPFHGKQQRIDPDEDDGEAAWDLYCESFYGGSSPMTASERMEAAAKKGK